MCVCLSTSSCACVLYQRMTGITDIRKMVSSFIEVEDRNFGMFQYIQVSLKSCLGMVL